MFDSSVKVKFNVSGCLKDLNRRYHKNYTLVDVARCVGVSRETLSRLTSFSNFNLVYSVAYCIYEFYPEYNGGFWDFVSFLQLLAYDDHSFIL